MEVNVATADPESGLPAQAAEQRAAASDRQARAPTWGRYRWPLLGVLLAGMGIGVAGVAATSELVHWSSSTPFCSSACHNMIWAEQAYQRGSHFKTASGVTAGCADCHIPYESSQANPFQYVSMLAYKARAGARDAYNTLLGTIGTEEKWEANRERLAEQVRDWMVGSKFMTCRGCHDLQKFRGDDDPMNVVQHSGLLEQDSFDCLQCHQGVGHEYGEPPPRSR
jgi:nitrate/TMAO reductase-like tetraheme cytochrome c subunit